VQVARRWQLTPPGKDGLFDPAIAVPLGAAHLKELLDHHGNDLPVTLAAYNAGSNAVAHWIPDKTVEADVWIENIPFNETRGYVQHILEHIVAFAFVRDAEPTRLEALLPPVTPGM
jgi:soluble lytic murein transglycosylase